MSEWITSWFVAKGELRFPVVQMVVFILLVTSFVFIMAFWPEIKKFFKRFRN
jgi:hypothetical protein